MTYSIEVGAIHKRCPYLLSDLIELLLVTRHEGNTFLSKSSIDSLIRDGTLAFDEVDDLESNFDSDISTADKHDLNQEYLDDLWAHLSYRENRFKGFYPFKISPDEVSICNPLSDAQYIYIFLLALSRLRSFSRVNRSLWAGYFASFSAIAIRGILPAYADVKVFDANSPDRRDFYGTDKRNALIKLGKQLNAYRTHEETIKKESSSGDAGLDVVGVISFNDKASDNFIVLVQCAAREKNWPTKTLEASPVKLKAFFTFLSDPTSITCIPMCYREANDKWYKESSASGTLLLDRHRLLEIVSKSNLLETVYQQDWWESFKSGFTDPNQTG